MKKLELLAEANDCHALLETARRSQDFNSAQAITDKLTSIYRQLHLLELQAEAEAKGVIV